uniref:Putative secreted protein n=1 Tax=Ixodes ricinus TaxID=34613 RepID=A0A6B0V0G7_IXORI
MAAALPAAATPWGPVCCSATARASARASRAWKGSAATAALPTFTTSRSKAAGRVAAAWPAAWTVLLRVMPRRASAVARLTWRGASATAAARASSTCSGTTSSAAPRASASATQPSARVPPDTPSTPSTAPSPGTRSTGRRWTPGVPECPPGTNTPPITWPWLPLARTRSTSWHQSVSWATSGARTTRT